MTHQLTNYPLQLGAGSVGAPSLHFGDATTGFYRHSANIIGAAISGVCKMAVGETSLRFGYPDIPAIAAGAQRIAVAADGGASQVEQFSWRSAANLCVFNAHAARGTAAAPANLNSGDNGIVWRLRVWQSGTTYTDSASIRIVASEAHSSTALGTRIEFYTTANTTTSTALAMSILNSKAIKCEGSFSTFGATPPATKPAATGSKGSNAALTSVIAILVNYGLMTDSTT
jgi:hypothetical protein